MKVSKSVLKNTCRYENINPLRIQLLTQFSRNFPGLTDRYFLAGASPVICISSRSDKVAFLEKLSPHRSACGGGRLISTRVTDQKYFYINKMQTHSKFQEHLR